jgi:hypothetical protein
VNFVKIDARVAVLYLRMSKGVDPWTILFFCPIRMKLVRRNAYNNVLSDCDFHENWRPEILLEGWNEYVFLPPLLISYSNEFLRKIVEHNVFFIIFKFRENRHRENCTFLVGVNELHLYMCAETVWHSVSNETLARAVC